MKPRPVTLYTLVHPIYGPSKEYRESLSEIRSLLTCAMRGSTYARKGWTVETVKVMREVSRNVCR